MELDSILRLIEAGFTKEDIMSMTQEKQPQEAEKQPEIKKDEVPEEKTPEKNEGLEVQNEYLKAVQEMTDEVKRIREDLKKTALRDYDEQVISPLDQGHKVLAKIIDPEPPKKKGKEKA